MTSDKTTRLSKVAREFNVGISTIVEFLHKKGFVLDSNPNTKVPEELYILLVKEYSSDVSAKKESEKLSLSKMREKRETISINDIHPAAEEDADDDSSIPEQEILIKDFSSRSASLVSETKPAADRVKIVGKIDLEKKPAKAEPEKKESKPEPIEEQKPIEEKPAQKEKEEVVEDKKTDQAKDSVKVVGKIDLDSLNQKTRPDKKTRKQKDDEKEQKESVKTPEKKIEKQIVVEEQAKPIEKTIEPVQESVEPKQVFFKSEVQRLTGPTVVGRIVLPEKDKDKKPVASSNDLRTKKKKRKRIHKEFSKPETTEKKPVVTVTEQKKDLDSGSKLKKKKKRQLRPEVSDVDVQKQIKDTLARLTGKGKSKGSKHRREKREALNLKQQEDSIKLEADKQILKVTEFVSVNELASMMDAPVVDVISVCMNLGLMVSINQRLDAETMALVADEFNFKVQFISVEVQEAIKEEEDTDEELVYRPPIVTVMGHVDHGKTSLLDFVRKANVIAGEAGGITQHIGAYSVGLDNGKTITFLDTPGHEAFTAMRARGAQVTDIAIIVVSADDNVMPQTVEAINHASAAGVPIIFAINKIDKAGANPEKIKEELANMNYLVEEWGGKYQSQDISAKKGTNVDLLLEKILLEAELLDLKANPNKRAHGTVIESELDKGRGYISTVLVEAGTLKIGDVIIAGSYFGHVKAMYNERSKRIEGAGPSTPVQILGLNGAPQAGDKFNVMESDKEARDIANKREQLQREQSLRTQKHITLDEIGRRIAIGNFQEINIVVKGDVDGSIEALSDSLIKLGTNEIQVNIIHKGVGQISESDVLLAAASNAIIIGFQVRPSMNARKLAEKEEIDIRLYSIIYDAINEVRDAMEGMLSPEMKEEIVATVEVRDVFKIKKVGSVAGCMVREGKINRNTRVRVIRDGIVIYTGNLGSLKRFKDDVKEVLSGYECGLNIDNFNDIKVGDIVEGYQEVEVKKKL
ncbi:MAG: translation initiation factor IF-2 [Bacteroidetes bacterium GWF2_33_16]|nr:MAG: translation initiation factor IF-2 [Bacteroidetes bacterium GWE2_32_14]OFY03962.1 MAG: translation initiation factor IF-2 [Bacteroidetes bacterium GWF2_33_16]